MRALFIVVVLAMGLLPPAAFAQGGPRGGSLPNRSPGQFRSPGPTVGSPGRMVRSPGRPARRRGNAPRVSRDDVFRARPWTYRPGRSQLFFRGGGGYYPYPYYPFPSYPLHSYPYFYPYYPLEQMYPDSEPTVTVFPPPPSEATPAAPPAPAPPQPYVAGPPGPPKTFYIIPGCYAGDRRPDPASLAPRCSISKLRVIPPSP